MSKIQQIEISFPVPVEMPDGFDQALSALVGIICKQYQKENPTRAMWTAGHGAKPLWMSPTESGEPEFDSSIYHIDVSEREDTAGANIHNPDRKRLRDGLRERREKAKKERTGIRLDLR